MRASEEALYVFELGQIIFNSSMDGEDWNLRASSLRTSHLTRWPSNTQQSVRVMAVTDDVQSEDSRSDESRNGSSSSEGMDVKGEVTSQVMTHVTMCSAFTRSYPVHNFVRQNDLTLKMAEMVDPHCARFQLAGKKHPVRHGFSCLVF